MQTTDGKQIPPAVCVFMNESVLFDDAIFAENLSDFVQCDVNMLDSVCGHQAETDKGVV
jgi:hypothetical protein